MNNGISCILAGIRSLLFNTQFMVGLLTGLNNVKYETNIRNTKLNIVSNPGNSTTIYV